MLQMAVVKGEYETSGPLHYRWLMVPSVCKHIATIIMMFLGYVPYDAVDVSVQSVACKRIHAAVLILESL